MDSLPLSTETAKFRTTVLPDAIEQPGEAVQPLQALTLTPLAIEELFAQHWKKLFAWLRRIVHCQETAADLAQEAYLRLVATSGTRSVPYPRAFLFRTATNLALDHLRREKARFVASATLDEALEIPSQSPSVERVVLDKQRLEKFLQVIGTLPPRCREVFLLHRVHEHSYGEIARRLGISESAVEKHIMRALIHCRKALEEKATGME